MRCALPAAQAVADSTQRASRSHGKHGKPLAALRRIRSAPRVDGKPVPTRMPTVHRPFQYSSWVPITLLYKHTLEEPYVLSFGDRSAHLARADRTYDDMCHDFRTATGRDPRAVSDEDALIQSSNKNHDLDDDDDDNESDNFDPEPTSASLSPLSPHNSNPIATQPPAHISSFAIAPHHHPLSTYTLHAARNRAAIRHAALQTVSHYGRHPQIWVALARGLSLTNACAARSLHKRASSLSAEAARCSAKRAKARATTAAVSSALCKPDGTYSELDFVLLSSSSDSKMMTQAVQFPRMGRFFCKLCMRFLCESHPDPPFLPRVPIKDYSVTRRKRAWCTGELSMCNRRCFLARGDEAAMDPGEFTECELWPREELAMLREAVLIFGRDPCSVAVALSKRSCRETHWKMSEAAQQWWIDEALDLVEKPRRDAGGWEWPGEMECVESQAVSPRKKDNRRRRRVPESSDLLREHFTAVKTTQAEKETNGKPVNADRIKQFRPCNHEGVCEAGKCPCQKEGWYCETRCGCNGGRHYEEDGKLVLLGPECQMTSNGCSCVEGHCVRASCECVKYGNACNPNSCRCECSVLPADCQTGRGRRRRQGTGECRNFSFSLGRPKRMFMGVSHVHGLGLFAGDYVEQGDVIGVYYGLLWSEAQLATSTSALQVARSKIYAFDMTSEHSVDAMLMGAKCRFCNHGNSKSENNCKSETLRIRGDVYICLRATRSVKPGEELLFEYNLMDVEQDKDSV